MPDFSYDRLRRSPDVEAENLFAYDATDRMLVEHALASSELVGTEVAVIGDEYGAITLALTDAGLEGVRVHQDSATGRIALARNAESLGLAGFTSHELDRSLLEGARLVLLQLPKALSELEEIADAVARWAAPDVVLVAGGRVKHMTITQNEVLGRSFSEVQAQRAERKSRLIVASGVRPVPDEPPYPQRATHAEFALTLASHGGAFAASRIDIGTRVLLEVLADSVDADATQRVIDLGCGTGALAAFYALNHPDARITATDRSAAAVASARETMIANGVADRVTVTHDDAGADLPDASADLILLNPPFHLGASIHTRAATRLFEAAARLLRPGGELLTVYNSSLEYKAELSRLIGRTEQVRRTAKFTVTRSFKR
ncbi:SAM-dependent methyltransferase [Microbacterium sp. CH12i]|uniref:class I SAM-dependent methyltransferase n=1 Tax=Microbacterium sp. CH12i TaxID=1479651 RepID=UPI000461E8CA|nr:methyltransferase [Microbacterium sp. CH12i]KDA04762.1 SAM-dependent methyltransferase [Microbacterium sp. CH12i]